jgi:hypothetical protein
MRKDSKYERQIRTCRHHGETEFYFASDNRGKGQGGAYKCLACQREQNKRHKEGKKVKPMPGCSNYVGLYIAEQVLKKAFDVMVKALPMEHWDFVCGHGFTVDSKCSTLRLSGREGCKSLGWEFHIEKNKYPKYFCLIALDNTPEDVAEDPRPIHVWLIPGDAVIDGRPLNDRVSLTVGPNTIAKLKPYRRTDMEGRIIKCCNHLKEGEA